MEGDEWPQLASFLLTLGREHVLRLLLFPEESSPMVGNLVGTFDSSLGPTHRTRVQNTFISVDADDKEADLGSRASSEPKDFKPISTSSSSLLGGMMEDDCLEDWNPSDTEVPADRQPSKGSCTDKSCVVMCVWHRRGSCRFGEDCRACHHCSLEDIRRNQLAVQASAGARRQAPSALGSRFPSASVGSCKDGTCRNGCAFYMDQMCKKQQQCTYCHVCAPSQDALERRAALQYYQELRSQKKKKKKAAAPLSRYSCCVLRPCS